MHNCLIPEVIVLLRNLFGVCLIPSITQRFYRDVFTKEPIQLSKMSLFSVLELANKSMSINDNICTMGDFNYPSNKWNGILTHVRDFEFVETIRDAYLYQMVTKPTKSRLGQTANINDLVRVNDEPFTTEIGHCCPLGKSDHQVLKFSMQLDC